MTFAVASPVAARLASDSDGWRSQDAVDSWNGFHFRQSHLQIIPACDIGKYLICRFFDASVCDMQPADCLYGQSGQEKAVWNLQSRGVNQFRAHGTSLSTDELERCFST